MRISIILTSYNYEEFISQSIESVIAQTICDWELIIIDDGSKDNSVNIIKSYCEKDSRIKLFTHPQNKNKGLVASVKLGLEKAQNDWIAFLESDDYLAPNYLEEKFNFLKKYPECKFLYNNVECFGNLKKVEKFKGYFLKLDKLWDNEEFKDVFDEFGAENIVPTFSCVMCNKQELLKYDLNPICPPVFDYWIWWQMAENNKFGFINKRLTFWQIHEDSYLLKSCKTFKHHIKRSLFVSKILKKFKRKCELTGENKIEQNMLLSIAKYICLYIKRKSPRFIKNIIRGKSN